MGHGTVPGQWRRDGQQNDSAIAGSSLQAFGLLSESHAFDGLGAGRLQTDDVLLVRPVDPDPADYDSREREEG